MAAMAWLSSADTAAFIELDVMAWLEEVRADRRWPAVLPDARSVPAPTKNGEPKLAVAHCWL